MRSGLSQSQRLGQELKINPRLYQAMDMLYMPLLELQQHLKQELDQNPFLELVEPEDDASEAEADAEAAGEETEEAPDPEEAAAAEAVASEETDWEAVLLDGFDVGSARVPEEEREAFEPLGVTARDLRDHLRDQVALLALTDRERALADEFIGNIDDDGYLGCSLDDLLSGINEVIAREARAAGRDDAPLPLFTRAEAEAMLATIQTLDPPGVGARDLRECLLLQLTEAGQGASLPARLVREAFDELAARKWTELARRYGITPAEAQAAGDAVARLDPKPGLRHAPPGEDYVIPDLTVERIDGEYRVFANDGHVPRLRLSRSYTDLARERRKLDPEQREFINTRLNAAQWLVQAIEQRRQTMLKVMHVIVDRQREFLEKGIKHLRPLTLREVADVIGMHESTVSRVTNEKWVQTPRGVLPLKFFFSSALSTTDGEDASARAIRAQLEQLVRDEDPHDPLTDQQIVTILKERGVNIARRTVAKYRDQLGVLPARMRKRV